MQQEAFKAENARRDREAAQKRMTAIRIAQENKARSSYVKEQTNASKWADKMKEDDIMKEPINKYNNWIR